MIKGKHLIAGEWVSGDSTFESSPSSGAPMTFPNGTTALVDQAVTAAEDAFASFGSMPRIDRAAFIQKVADEIEAQIKVIMMPSRKAVDETENGVAAVEEPTAI